MKTKTINIDIENNIARIYLNRPEVHNALNPAMVIELYNIFNNLRFNNEVKLIIMSGTGNSFCSGADLNWMRNVMSYDYDQNYKESLQLANLLYLIYRHPKPIISRVNGTAIGGGVGLILASDIVIASEIASFGISEVKIGLVPAAIIQFLKERIGATKARELLITGERIKAKSAEKIGLINYAVPLDELDNVVNEKAQLILQNGPVAISTVKRMMSDVEQLGYPEIKQYLAETIASLRTSEEGQEGMHAFFEKRKPNWIYNYDQKDLNSKQK